MKKHHLQVTGMFLVLYHRHLVHIRHTIREDLNHKLQAKLPVWGHSRTRGH